LNCGASLRPISDKERRAGAALGGASGMSWASGVAPASRTADARKRRRRSVHFPLGCVGIAFLTTSALVVRLILIHVPCGALDVVLALDAHTHARETPFASRRAFIDY
jgi:hypothetical protein